MKTFPLRQLPDGARFVLMRTGEHFRRLQAAGTPGGGVWSILVIDHRGKRGTLNHQCEVAPIVKPRIRLKVKS